MRIDRLKVVELLAFLALRRTAVVDRDTVVSALWPEADYEVGRNRLKSILALLRRDVPDLPVVSHGKHALELLREQVEIDVEKVEARLKWLRALSPREQPPAARQLWDLVSPGLLPELKTPWILPEQARFADAAERLLKEFSAAPAPDLAAFRFGDRFGGARAPLVGRAEEMRQIQAWLDGPSQVPLLLVGPPGVGKTRLLVEAVAPERGASDAVVTLSTVQAFEAPWLERIGQAIGVRDAGQVTESLVQLLRGFRRPLLAIDDFDQAGAEMREWLSLLARRLPALRLMGTCRWRDPGITAEYLDVRPLPSSGGTELLTCFASQFGMPKTQLEREGPALAEIAAVLEGLPLAIEVAAGWLPYAPPKRLLEQLSSSMNLVIDRRAEEHDSLRDCVRAMCRTLTTGEREALRVLSICKGGCGHELGNLLFATDWAILIRSLSERSLVFSVEGRHGTRFVSLQAIRESVAAIETQEDLERALRSHQCSMFELGERAAWETSEGDRKGWLDFLRDEADNLLAACSRNLEDPNVLDRSVRVLHNLRAPFYLIRRTSEFSKVQELTIRLASVQHPGHEWSTPPAVLWARVRDLWDSGDPRAAVEMATAYRRSNEQHNPSLFDVAQALDFESGYLRMANELHAAFGLIQKAHALHLQAGYPHHALWLEAKLNQVDFELGRWQDAQDRRARALQRAIEIEDWNSVGTYKKVYARKAFLEGSWRDAVQLARESIDAYMAVGEPTTTFDAYLVLAASFLAGEDRKSALAALNESAEFALLADPESLPKYNQLMDAALHGTPIDLRALDPHPGESSIGR